MKCTPKEKYDKFYCKNEAEPYMEIQFKMLLELL